MSAAPFDPRRLPIRDDDAGASTAPGQLFPAHAVGPPAAEPKWLKILALVIGISVPVLGAGVTAVVAVVSKASRSDVEVLHKANEDRIVELEKASAAGTEAMQGFREDIKGFRGDLRENNVTLGQVLEALRELDRRRRP